MSTAQQVIDEIGALVDEQLQQEASGYDWNLNQPRCRCGRSWHGIASRRCPGTDVEGPLARHVPPSNVSADDEGPLSVRPEEFRFLAARQAIMTRVIQLFDIPPEIVGLYTGRDGTEGWWTYDPS